MEVEVIVAFRENVAVGEGQSRSIDGGGKPAVPSTTADYTTRGVGNPIFDTSSRGIRRKKSEEHIARVRIMGMSKSDLMMSVDRDQGSSGSWRGRRKGDGVERLGADFNAVNVACDFKC
jgi:hypothetical protein